MRKQMLMVKRAITFAAICVLAIGWVVNGYADTIFQSVGIASSPNPVGSGARALGMGGAFIAVADDATAASWNPAGLVQLERPEISIVGDYVYRKEEFSSASRPEIANSGSTDEIRHNYLSATIPFSFLNRNMAVSANFQRLYDFERNFDHIENLTAGLTGPGVIGTQEVDYSQDGYLGAIGLAFASELTPWLSLGVTLNIWADKLGLRNGWDETAVTQSVISGINPGTGLIPIPPQRESITTRDEFDNFNGINWNFGLLWEINQYVTVGAVLKTDFWGDVDHTFTQTNRDDTGNITSVVQIDEDAELRLPLSYGVGISCRFSDRFTADLDVYRTEWDDFIFKDGQGNKFSPIDGRPETFSDVDDTIQARLGAEYLFLLPQKQLVVPLRGGIFYDPEPNEGSPRDFYGISVGSGIGYKKYIFDVAYQFRWTNDEDGESLITTGDTDVDVRQHTVLASLILHF